MSTFLDRLLTVRQAAGAPLDPKQIPPDAAPDPGLPTVSVAGVTPKPVEAHPAPVPVHVRAGLGILQRMLEVLENTFSITNDNPLILDLTSGTGADQFTDPIAQTGRLRALYISTVGGAAAGLTTVSLYYPGASQAAPGAGQNGRVIFLAEMAQADRATAENLNIRVPAGAKLAIKTTVTTPTHLILTAIVTRESETGVAWFRGHRGA